MEFVENSNDFDKLWKTKANFKVAQKNKEGHLYIDTKSLIEPIGQPLGLHYMEFSGKKEADKKYPDGLLVLAPPDPHNPDKITDAVRRTISLDIEVKRTWNAKKKQCETPWDALSAQGTSGSTPSSGLHESIERALLFFSVDGTQQRQYFSVITDLQKFVFFCMDRAGLIKLTFPIEYSRSVVAIIWYLCSQSLRANGFRNCTVRDANETFSAPMADLGPVSLETDTNSYWLLDSFHQLGKGANGLVFACLQYNGSSMSTRSRDRHLCLKLAPYSTPQAYQLDLEAAHLALLSECSCVPKVIAVGRLVLDGICYRALLTDVVGISLGQLSYSKRLALLPTLWPEMRRALLQIHAHNIVHADIKPDHFVVNRSGLWIVDFGSAFNPASCLLREGNLHTTSMFASKHVLNTEEWPNFLDDVQAAAYSFIALLTSNCALPEGHQHDATLLFSSVRPQHRPLVGRILDDAHISLPLPDANPGSATPSNKITAPNPKKRKHHSHFASLPSKRAAASNGLPVLSF